MPFLQMVVTMVTFFFVWTKHHVKGIHKRCFGSFIKEITVNILTNFVLAIKKFQVQKTSRIHDQCIQLCISVHVKTLHLYYFRIEEKHLYSAKLIQHPLMRSRSKRENPGTYWIKIQISAYRGDLLWWRIC